MTDDDLTHEMLAHWEAQRRSMESSSHTTWREMEDLKTRIAVLRGILDGRTEDVVKREIARAEADIASCMTPLKYWTVQAETIRRVLAEDQAKMKEVDRERHKAGEELWVAQIRKENLESELGRLRWFGADRKAQQKAEGE